MANLKEKDILKRAEEMADRYVGTTAGSVLDMMVLSLKNGDGDTDVISRFCGLLEEIYREH